MQSIYSLEESINPNDLARVEELSILGFVVAKKPINKETLRSTMQSVWKLKGRVIFKQMATNVFVVKFQNTADLQIVQEG